jgi:hypothetical protein
VSYCYQQSALEVNLHLQNAFFLHGSGREESEHYYLRR